MPPGNAKFLMDSVFGLAIRMNQFGLSDAEIGLFCAVVIITAGKILWENQLKLYVNKVTENIGTNFLLNWYYRSTWTTESRACT